MITKTNLSSSCFAMTVLRGASPTFAAAAKEESPLCTWGEKLLAKVGKRGTAVHTNLPQRKIEL